MRCFLFLMTLLLFPVSCLALFCPGSFNNISMGDSLETVVATCGNPASINEYNKPAKVPQEWNFYQRLNPTDTGTMKVTVAFEDNQVINISVNGIGMGSTNICGNTAINVGDSMDRIEQICGKPAFINMAQGSYAMGAKVTEITYAGSPPVKLTFEDGKLIKRSN